MAACFRNGPGDRPRGREDDPDAGRSDASNDWRSGPAPAARESDRDRGDTDRYRYKEILINRHCVNEWQEYFLVGVGEKCASTAKILASVSDPDTHY